MSNSPFASPGSRTSPGARESPSLTLSQLRSRGNGSTKTSPSPASTTTSTFSDSVSTHIPLRPLSSMIGAGDTDQRLIRSDPGMMTSFEPSDRELYDLWAPRT
ncbi:unnamed protein product [Peniophora sp. CBMAI 1063]|nr:unnamed protein product [Peniophora sp. CBMAI 1063]